MTKAFHATNKHLIDELRRRALNMIAVIKREHDTRQVIEQECFVDQRAMVQKAKESELTAKELERQRIQRLIAAVEEEHEKERTALCDYEGRLRAEFFQACDQFHKSLQHEFAQSMQTAMERQARREHQEAERILMHERREIRDARRTREMNHMLEQVSKQMSCTAKHESQMMRAVYNAQLRNDELKKDLQGKAEEHLMRQKKLEERMGRINHENEEKMRENLMKRFQTSQAVARKEIAMERHQRVLREDFEWQKLEQQMLKAQQLGLEESRKQFLREKAVSDKQRRQEIAAVDQFVRDEKRREIEEFDVRKSMRHLEKEDQKRKEENKIFSMLCKFREEARSREREKLLERSIGWENDRRERMLLQRPDITKDDMDRFPLSARVPPPAPFVMANSSPTYGKVWVPFEIVRFDVSPNKKIRQGMPFAVSWMCTRMPQSSAYITVCSGAGEVARQRVKKAVDELYFVAPTEWFSGLDVSFVIGDKVLKSLVATSA
jgi:hypothetical protein